MFERKIHQQLENHLTKKQVTVITGLRRVGKSTLLKFLFKNYKGKNKLYIDLERIENQNLFNVDSYAKIERSLELMGFDFNKPGLIALDEIQQVKNCSSIIKAWYDDYGTKFIVTGSSSFYLKNHFSESLAGRKRIFEIHPLDFEEFLTFKGIDSKRIQGERLQTFLPQYYNNYQKYYEEFVRFGGLPEVVLADSQDDKIAYLKDVLNSHIELDVKLLGDISASTDLYKLIHLLASRVGSKLDFSKIASLLGVNRNKVKDYIQLLEHTYLIRTIPVFAKGNDKLVSKQPKLFFTDQGLLQLCGQLSSGAIFENMVCNQLAILGELCYYEKNTGTEIDFVLDKTTAIEVKETPGDFDLRSLERRAKLINADQRWLIGRKLAPSGFDEFIWGGSLF